MLAHRSTAVFAMLALSIATAAAGATGAAATKVAGGLPEVHAQPFTVQELVRLARISEIAASPDGKRVAYTLRTTDMEENKGRTSIWLVETGKRSPTALPLTDAGAGASAAEWSADGRFIYFLSSRSGSSQVWRVTAGNRAPPGGAGGAARAQK